MPREGTMRTICLAGVLGVVLMAAAVSAEETATKGAAVQPTPVAAPAAAGAAAPAAAGEKAGVFKPIETGDDDDAGGTADERTGVNEGRVLPTQETYDPNTGLSDNVPSDAVGNLE